MTDLNTRARLAREAAMMRYAAELMNQGGVGKFLAQEMLNRMQEAEDYVRKQEAAGICPCGHKKAVHYHLEGCSYKDCECAQHTYKQGIDY